MTPHVWLLLLACAHFISLILFFYHTSLLFELCLRKCVSLCLFVMTERVLDSTWSPSHSGKGLWPHQRVRVPADFLTLRGEQTKLLIKCPMTERTVGGMVFDTMPFTIYYLFYASTTAWKGLVLPLIII